MSEIKEYGHIGYLVEATPQILKPYPAMTVYVLAADFATEHYLRLAAERQVGELREQLVSEKSVSRDFAQRRDEAKAEADRSAGREEAMRTKLDTAMGLLREIQDHHKGKLGFMHQSIRNFLNTTSTEGKDHD